MNIQQATDRMIRWLAVLGMAGMCLPALAQDGQKLEAGEPVPAEEPGTQRSPMQFTVGGSLQARTDVDNGGNFSLSRFRTGVTIPVRYTDQLTLAPTVKYELASYDFGGGIDAWHNINTLSGAVLLQYRPNQHWVVYGGPIVRFSAEAGAAWSNAKQGGGLLAVNYVVSDTLSLGGGIFVMSQIENNAAALPILTANWKFADDWKLTLGFTDMATSGYGVGVSWDCSPEWQMTFGVQVNKSRFRIDGDGATNDAVGQNQGATLTTALTWAPNKTVSVTGFLGIAGGGEVLLEDSTGHKIRSDDYDPAPIAGLSASLRY